MYKTADFPSVYFAYNFAHYFLSAKQNSIFNLINFDWTITHREQQKLSRFV